ncbi:lactate permease LctP family transporter [Terrilactibacillus laevilacticus]|uniref:L-lactate permease n=1 Tax=Terrilactibacillus laevilacticus TaxID=1380157 RepID=A0ABW5PUG7_9BACI|nr:lactate permease LctP family transporter [Terrilactibacillus laevilacticus]
MMNWTQIYDPMNNIWFSAIVAVIPIVIFFLALTVFKIKGHIAAFITVLSAILVALIFYHMPLKLLIGATGYGFVYALWPIAYIVIGAVFLYKLSVKSGQFEIIRQSIVSLTDDQRLQMLLVAFAFNSFLEGAAGFGAPIAITAALLVGLGFDPLKAAGLCLIANIAPGTVGAMGIPVIVAGQVTGIDPKEISINLSNYLPIISFIMPFFLVVVMDSFKGLIKIWKPTFVAAIFYAISQWATFRFIGPELPDIIAPIVCIIALAVYLKVFQRKDAKQEQAGDGLTLGKIVKAWSPFIVLTICVSIWCTSIFKNLFLPGGLLEKTTLNIPVPWLNNLVIKSAPLVPKPTPYAAMFKLDLISATGTAILVSCVVSMILLKVSLKAGGEVLAETIKELYKPILTIMLVLAFAFVANYSGESSTLGIALANTGHYFPIFAPVLGWLGVFLTGSVVSANALFGGLQQITANQIHVAPLVLISANVAGGAMAKMISPQSIAVASGSVGLVGRESELFRFTVKYSLIFLVFVCIVSYVQSIL